MKLKISFLPVFLFSLIALDSASAQEICFNGFFKPNSTYDLNRRQVLSSLASNVTSHKGFFNSSIGENPNRVFIIGMCIPGTKPVTCSDCIKAASDTLLKSCPNQTEAYTWSDSCMVRYSNVPFSGSYDIGPSHVLYKSGVLNSNVTVFDRIGEDLMERTITEAPTRAHEHKYYTAGLASLTASLTMYAMMQCTPELSTGYCGLCLRTNLDNYKLCCRDKQGGSITRPSCFIRWDVHPFAGAFENLTLPPPQPQSLPQPPLSLPPPVSNPASKTDKDGEALSIGIIVAILVPIVVILVLLVVGFMVWRRSKAYQTVTIQAGDEIIPLNSLQFKFKTIEAATDKFSDSNMIGQGGFGEVYKTCFNGYFKLNSTYDLSRSQIFSSLASNVTTHNGLYRTSLGQNQDRIFVIGMCIPGNEPQRCSDCIKSTSDGLLRGCPNQTAGYAWPDVCMVRYSNISFSGSLVMEPSEPVSDPKDIGVNLTVFDRVWEELMLRTIAAASSGSRGSFGHKYYAAEIATLTSFQTIYSMMQCTPDVSSGDCEFCLKETVSAYNSCCRGHIGGAYVRPFCFIRWNLYPFAKAFDNITLSERDRANITSEDKKTISTVAIVAIVVPIFVIFVLLVVGLLVCRRKEQYQNLKVQGGDEITTTHSLQFSFKEIEAATDNFADSNMIGRGGFGEVYRGMLSTGTEVAVKRLSKSSGQGAQEFKNEAVLVTKLQHKNLVRPLGFCLEGEEKILVYEFVPNKSLDYFLFDPKKQGELDWKRRYNIIGGTARGLLYLHHDSRLTIIHRDLKASNILLDSGMNPKIADFGMARIFGVDQSQANTSRIVGTYGYMSPEYAMHGHFSMKSDVYSFGVLVLEIISGKKCSSLYHIDESFGNLVTHAWRLWKAGSPLELVDPTIVESYESNEAIRCIHIALLCVQEDPADRPMLPAIILMLTSSTATLHVPRAPGTCLSSRCDWISNGLESTHSTSRSIPGSINDVTISDLDPR
ncbi:hypothetical protein DY000_02015319 [Brassica cretica]|uniref:Uncharacterized protein n=1 Tax=Brassica cretica TaxID=69181 RepID=A0ABQ7D0U7_BRACR|nr:hypothetical protein DY000_02015319 [Brassica cretica]